MKKISIFLALVLVCATAACAYALYTGTDFLFYGCATMIGIVVMPSSFQRQLGVRLSQHEDYPDARGAFHPIWWKLSVGVLLGLAVFGFWTGSALMGSFPLVVIAIPGGLIGALSAANKEGRKQ